MIVAPAVDLRGGRCVQLVGGRPENEAISLPDPASVARDWSELGFRSLHVVDLDAALGLGDNLATITDVLSATEAETQVGGGVRDDARAEQLLEAGADRIVVGTRAIEDPEWLDATCRRWPGRVVLALDHRGGLVVTRGWTDETGDQTTSLLDRFGALPLAGVLCTDVGREGRLEGIDREGCARVVASSPHPVWISGGVTTMDELAFLEDRGAHGVVLGMAIYTDTLDRRALADRWG